MLILYGFRPKRSAKGAITEIRDNLKKGKTEVFDADILEQKWFDVQPFRIDSYTAAYFCKPIA